MSRSPLLQHLAIVAEQARLLLRCLPLGHQLGGMLEHVLIYVAQRHDFDGRHLDQSQQVDLAVPAAADQPHAPLLFFRVGAGGEGGAQGGSQKISSVHHISVWRTE